MESAINPKTLQEAVVYFADWDNCQRFMILLRWHDGKVKCPTCGADKVTYLEKARVWKCYGKHEKAKFSLKVGTIFEDSPISLDKWFVALWLLTTCRNGVSSYEIARSVGVSQKSAWHMMHRLRFALQDPNHTMLSGEVEVDESFIGGAARNMHQGRRQRMMQGPNKGKTIVVGMVERGGKVKTAVVERRRKTELQKFVRENVEKGSAIFSDELLSYDGLSDDFKHQVINHAVEYARENVHTNTMENFWSLLKRQLKGTHVNVEPFHLHRYLDELCFRFNYRKSIMGEFQRFQLAAHQVVGKRLTWDEVTGKNADGQTAVQ